MMLHSIFLFLLAATVLITVRNPVSQADYTAAVVEHASLSWLFPTINEDQAKSIAGLNLDSLYLYTAHAASREVDIIVFPEYGVTGFIYEKRDYVVPFLETVPDPLKTQPEKPYIPCHLKDTSNIIIQQRLSCMALKHNITVVANLMTVYWCDGATDPDCPPDGRYQHNTDVVFGSSGQLLARYHKENLYSGEKAVFDPGHNQTKVASFITSFGSFGLFTCFDLIYAEPAARLIGKLGVDTMVFPTAWINELPLLTAVEYQQAWSLSYGVHLLAANIHYPFVQMAGSGIYSPSVGAVTYWYDVGHLGGKMLIGKVKNSAPSPRFKDALANETDRSYRKKHPVSHHSDTAGISGGISSSLLSGSHRKFAERESLVFETGVLPSDVTGERVMDKSIPKYFTAELNDDPYNLTVIEGTQGQAFVSNGNVTCLLDFARNADSELYALGAFDGLHTMNGNYYIQACALVRCASDTNPYHCGGEASRAKTTFQNFDLRMKGQSKETRLFPEVVTTNVRLPRPREEWLFSPAMDRIWSDSLKEPLIAANIFGRLYDLD